MYSIRLTDDIAKSNNNELENTFYKNSTCRQPMSSIQHSGHSGYVALIIVIELSSSNWCMELSRERTVGLNDLSLRSRWPNKYIISD